MGVLRYERAPSKEFREALQGPLAFLLDPQLRCGDRLLDAQFREDDRLMLYTGSTCVLAMQYGKGGRLRFNAADSYKRQHTTACTGALLFASREATDEQRDRVHSFEATSPNLPKTITDYLRALKVTDQWLGKESEVQMRARLVRGADAWWHLDREGVLGGGVIPPQAKSKVEEAWRDLLSMPAFEKRRPTTPLDLQDARAQDELDQLGIDSEGRLVLAELKYGGAGSNAAFIYAAPIQLLRYAWAWDAAIQESEVRRGLQQLLDAKRTLFPTFYEGCPASVGDGLRAVVAFGDRLRDDAEVQAKFWAAVECAQRHLPRSVRDQRIEVWNIAEGGTARRLVACSSRS